MISVLVRKKCEQKRPAVGQMGVSGGDDIRMLVNEARDREGKALEQLMKDLDEGQASGPLIDEAEVYRILGVDSGTGCLSSLFEIDES